MWNWLGNLLKFKLMLGSDQSPALDHIPGDVRQFSYKTLKMATDNFSYKLRKNGFSTSYKGTLANGSVVVVKVFEPGKLDFINMITIMSGIKHRNMVELIGCCIEGNLEIIVHEFVGDFSLDQLLFTDSAVEHARLDWPSRVSICHGIARSLEYLVNGISPGVVNLEVKPSNILLDRSFNPKIADFDISDVLEGDESGTIRGTIGYLDPEYIITGRFTDKTDVYAFGITLLELISGKKGYPFFQCESVSLGDWVWELREGNRVLECVDPALSEYSEDQVIRFVDVALFCIQRSSEVRPSMSESTNDYADGPDSEGFLSDEEEPR